MIATPSRRHAERSEESPGEAGPRSGHLRPTRTFVVATKRFARGFFGAELLRMTGIWIWERLWQGKSVKTAWVYIMANTHRTIYVGVTTDLERRVWEHKNHVHEGFTKRYNLTRLVYIAEFPDIDDAIAWEKALKGKTRTKKLALIAEQNPRWNDLAWNWYDEEREAVRAARV